MDLSREILLSMNAPPSLVHVQKIFKNKQFFSTFDNLVVVTSPYPKIVGKLRQNLAPKLM